jgi:ABC-type lipoprotein release transport system permease subunit
MVQPADFGEAVEAIAQTENHPAAVLSSIVYQATPRDPLVLAGVVLAMLLVGLLATWIPAQRALTLDPLRLLREE